MSKRQKKTLRCVPRVARIPRKTAYSVKPRKSARNDVFRQADANSCRMRTTEKGSGCSGARGRSGMVWRVPQAEYQMVTDMTAAAKTAKPGYPAGFISPFSNFAVSGKKNL